MELIKKVMTVQSMSAMAVTVGLIAWFKNYM